MPTAICVNGHTMHWRNQRGSRLKDARCSQCGEPVKKAQYNNDTNEWEPAPKRTRQRCEKHQRFYYDPGGCPHCSFDEWKKRQEANNG